MMIRAKDLFIFLLFIHQIIQKEKGFLINEHFLQKCIIKCLLTHYSPMSK